MWGEFFLNFSSFASDEPKGGLFGWVMIVVMISMTIYIMARKRKATDKDTDKGKGKSVGSSTNKKKAKGKGKGKGKGKTGLRDEPTDSETESEHNTREAEAEEEPVRRVVRMPRSHSCGIFGAKIPTRPRQINISDGHIEDNEAKKTLLAIIRARWPLGKYTFSDIDAAYPKWLGLRVEEFLYVLGLSARAELPPGPNGLPFLGNLLQIGPKPHRSLAKLAEQYGPLFAIRLGRVTNVVVSSAEMAEEVFRKYDAEFSGRAVPDAVAGGLQNHDLALPWISIGDQWRTIRRALSVYLTNPKKLDMLQGLRLKVVKQMVEHVKEISERGQVVNIGRLAFATALNQMSNTCFSTDVAHFNSDEDGSEFQNAVKTIMKVDGKMNFADYFPWLKIFDPQGIRRDAKAAYSWLDQLCEKFIIERLKHRESNFSPHGDLLDSFLDFRQENLVYFDLKHIKVLLMDLFIAGTDTNSSTIEWAMTELIQNPSIMQKLREELTHRIAEKGSLEEAEILEIPYLQSVLKETMRLHLVSPFLLPHKTVTNVKFKGYTIPKNTPIIINAWAIARDSNSWENPTDFTPERFLSSEIDYKGRYFSFLPFGSGRRICPGIRLAERVMSLMLLSLVAQFDWNLPNNMSLKDLDMDDTFGVTSQKATPLLLIPTTRNDQQPLKKQDKTDW
nr:PREDICTED: cytochrome P450 76AD1-like isoform X2 [Daucus carota subsp. sativus]